jgi:hypothetical protein
MLPLPVDTGFYISFPIAKRTLWAVVVRRYHV